MGSNLIDPATNESVFTFLSEFNRPWQGQTVIEVIILTLIFVGGVTGNSMVIAAVIRNKKLKTVTNLLVCNLAITDILFASGIPFIVVTRITQHWILGEFVCKFVTYMQFVSGVCSILTMVIISVERFICICLRNRYKIQNKDIIFIISGIWCLSAAYPIPVAISQTVRNIITADDKNYIFCGVLWADDFHAEVYLGFMVSFFFFYSINCYLRILFKNLERCKIFRHANTRRQREV